jgi:hypothetical protein
VFPGKVHHLRHFGFRHFEGVDAAHPYPLLMNMQHDGIGIFRILVEELPQDLHDKLHWRVVVIEQQNLVKRRLLRFRLGPRQDLRAIAALAISICFLFTHLKPTVPSIYRQIASEKPLS